MWRLNPRPTAAAAAEAQSPGLATVLTGKQNDLNCLTETGEERNLRKNRQSKRRYLKSDTEKKFSINCLLKKIQ